jgi:hypothetical protein
MMKKAIFASFALLFALFALFSCVVDPPPVVETPLPVDNTAPQKQYYTVYLKPPNNDVIGIGTRALSKDIAQMGHEFFEVVFIYNNNGTTHTARVSWELGSPSGLAGVYRGANGGTGADYSGMTATPAVNSGSAVIFVGKKDKTLLGIGKLSMVDGVAGALITSRTETVTFEVAALKAGVSATNDLPDKTNSSFWTDTTGGLAVSAANTVVETDIFIHNPLRVFPLFKLAPNAEAPTRFVTHAQYTFGFESETTNPSLATYWGAVIRAGKGMWEKRVPRYLITNGLYQYSSYLVQDKETTVTMTNNQTVGDVFVSNPPNPLTDGNPLTFTFDTTNTIDGSVFALAFSVPVYALSSTTGAGGDKAVMWYLRPGFDTFLFDLDDGKNGPGGAIFIGTGDVASYLPDGEGHR